MKKYIVIPDSFKGTLSATEVCDVMRDSLQRLFALPQYLFIYPGHGDGCSLGTALANIFG